MKNKKPRGKAYSPDLHVNRYIAVHLIDMTEIKKIVLTQKLNL